MRFWLSRNSAVTLREQLVTQVMLAIVSGDLKPATRLPSVRELARRYKIHFNTVSAAYQELTTKGWLQAEKGSGIFVASQRTTSPVQDDPLDEMIQTLFNDANARGIATTEILSRLSQIAAIGSRPWLVVDPELELAEIIAAEISDATGATPSAMSLRTAATSRRLEGFTVLALASRSRQVADVIPPGVPRLLLRPPSLALSFHGEQRPAREHLITVASRSSEILRWSRTLLIAAGIDPESLNICDAREPAWDRGISVSALVITDTITARSIPISPKNRILRMVGDASLAELRRFAAL